MIHTSDEKLFQILVQAAGDSQQRPQYYIGGNAALMAEKIASSFPRTTAYLVGPIGPRSQALLHPSIVRTNSTRIIKDEIHIIMEYKQGEILGEYVAPASSRFITSHDQYSGSSVVIEMFFKAISQFQPDLIILTGVHLIQTQNKEMRSEKLRLIKRNLLQLPSNIPIHLELGSIGHADYVAEVLKKIVPNVDSLGINEQELAFFSHIANGPYTDLYPVSPGAVHVHKFVAHLNITINYFDYYMNSKKKNFHVYRGTDWSNLAAGLAAGARTAAYSCNAARDINTDNLELRTSLTHVLDREVGKMYNFEPHKPIASWMRKDVVFIYTPVLVCKFPSRTVGIDDAISTSGLLFSQFHRFSTWMKRAVPPLLSTVRGIRRIRSKKFLCPDPIETLKKPTNRPVKWIEDATTYSDIHNLMTDPSSIPYSRKDMERLMHSTQEKMKKETKKKKKGINFGHIPISEQVVVMFPGQGSQYTGMGKKVIDCRKADEIYERASEILQYDLKQICIEGPKTKLDQTIYCQPAMLVTCLAAWEKFKQSNEWVVDKLTHTAGFSVGEIASLVLAGVISFEDAVKLVKIRAEAMNQCSQRISSGMLTIRTSAISRLSEAMKDAKLSAVEKNELAICEISNYLFCHVKVIGASQKCMDYLIQNKDKYSFQVVKKLAVSGAFHTTLMKEAAEPLNAALKDITINPPCINIFSNYTGELFHDSPISIKASIVKQIYNSVKWEQIQQHLFRLHRNHQYPLYMEVGPGRQLGAMFYNISKRVYAHYESFPA
ncbi:unnamed protein product [Dracunculus medinensis]|uniref:PKS_AT domain-containing protein n=1 Tax=Dracunculus medinensis TaxID=318479 RepID=A0A158Q536_DRAME|nr:unnamed protein product [Dracunculus medinensis]